MFSFCLNCGYNWYCCDWALVISTKPIVVISRLIHKSNNTNCRYQQLVLVISTIHLSILHLHCRYRQYQLSISTKSFVNIHNSNCCVHVLLISTIEWSIIVDINNVRTFLTKYNTWAQSYQMLISAIWIVDKQINSKTYQFIHVVNGVSHSHKTANVFFNMIQ